LRGELSAVGTLRAEYERVHELMTVHADLCFGKAANAEAASVFGPSVGPLSEGDSVAHSVTARPRSGRASAVVADGRRFAIRVGRAFVMVHVREMIAVAR
jgi:hypothetical protein